MLQTMGCLLAKSENRLVEPEMCRISTPYLEAVARKVVTFGLAENWPRLSFLKERTHGLESVRTLVLCVDWSM